MRAQASIEFLLIGSGVAAMCLFVIGFYAHSIFSQTSALAAIAGMFPNSSLYVQPPFVFNASTVTTTIPQPLYSASISGRNESLGYALTKPDYVVNMSEFSHCTAFGFFGHPFNITGQCGTTDAWDYFAGYDCMAMSGAYCTLPHNTTYATLEPTGTRSYLYTFTFLLSTPLGTASARVNSSSSLSGLLLNGHVVGNLSVVGVSSTDLQPVVTLMSHANSYTLANQTIYGIYSQDKNALYPLLSFYNGTGVDSATQSSIEQAVGAFASAQLRLVNSAGPPPGCSVISGNYVCAASSPFLYLINVTLAPGTGVVNQTIYYLGSVINLRSGA